METPPRRSRFPPLGQADAGPQIVFRAQSVVGGVIQIEDRLEKRVVIGNARENGLAVFRRNEMVCVSG